jgi:hypothetical protein
MVSWLDDLGVVPHDLGNLRIAFGNLSQQRKVEMPNLEMIMTYHHYFGHSSLGRFTIAMSDSWRGVGVSCYLYNLDLNIWETSELRCCMARGGETGQKGLGGWTGRSTETTLSFCFFSYDPWRLEVEAKICKHPIPNTASQKKRQSWGLHNVTRQLYLPMFTPMNLQ